MISSIVRSLQQSSQSAAKWGSGLLSVTLIAWGCTLIPGYAATSISASLGPVQRSIAVSDLEIFIETGEIPRSLKWYADRFTPSQLATLRQLLQQPIDVDVLTLERFTRLPAGETLLRRLLVLFNTTDPDSTYKALRSALIVAASREGGLTVANIIRSYPLSTININVDNVLAGVGQARELLIDDDAAIAYLRAIDTVQAEASARSVNNRSSLESPNSEIANPLESGPLAWIPSVLSYSNPLRPGSSQTAGLYLPQDPELEAPLVVISHGVGSSRNTFDYLARHLASKGFAVAAVEHPDTSASRFAEYLEGFADPPSPELFYQRPADITAVLDAIEAEPAFSSRIRTDNVGLVGQSLGGYTVLASAGARLDFEHAAESCETFEGELLPFNLSLLLQCSLLEMPADTSPIKDDRIGAVLAINPVSGTVFGPQGMEDLELPLMMVAGNNDFFAPAIPEQLYPFTWAGSERKHLVMVEGGTHFSFLSGFEEGAVQLPEAVIGPNPLLAHPVMNGLATAFFETYINGNPEYSAFLDRPSIPENSPFNYFPTQSLSNRELSNALGRES
ncbi:MAG: alpha/beta hydrolase [Synechococcus sp.]